MPTKITITQKEFEEFRIKFAHMIQERGLSCMTLSNDTEAKNFLAKYVEENITKNQVSNALQSISYKLANMRLNKYSKDKKTSEIEYPIINKYLGRMLLGSYFFEKLSDGTVHEVYVELKSSPIVLN